MRKRRAAAAIVAILSGVGVGAGVVGGAGAVTRTGTLGISVAVQSACSIAGGSLDFGTYTAGQATDKDALVSIAYTDCGPGTITFELDGGGAGDVSARKLRSGTNTMNYNLYKDSARTSLLGTGTNGRTNTLTAITSGTFAVYGRVPKSQAAAAGTYTDTVNITLTF